VLLAGGHVCSLCGFSIMMKSDIIIHACRLYIVHNLYEHAMLWMIGSFDTSEVCTLTSQRCWLEMPVDRLWSRSLPLRLVRGHLMSLFRRRRRKTNSPKKSKKNKRLISCSLWRWNRGACGGACSMCMDAWDFVVSQFDSTKIQNFIGRYSLSWLRLKKYDDVA
jgi:hypothetical protein